MRAKLLLNAGQVVEALPVLNAEIYAIRKTVRRIQISVVVLAQAHVLIVPA